MSIVKSGEKWKRKLVLLPYFVNAQCEKRKCKVWEKWRQGKACRAQGVRV